MSQGRGRTQSPGLKFTAAPTIQEGKWRAANRWHTLVRLRRSLFALMRHWPASDQFINGS